MGFDVSGLNPKMNVKEEDFKTLFKYNHNKYETFDEWHNALDEAGVRKEYQEQMEQFEDANPGIYFRNNVWWWRPLWDFVCDHCPDILTQEDMEHGCYNNNHEITEKKAKKIAKRLKMLIEDKTVSDYELAYEEYRKKKEESKDKKESFMGNYPFCQENIAKFAKFCEESGGFVIN